MFDIAGNGTYPALQFGQDSSYVYFRLQINDSNIGTTADGSYLIYIDRLAWQAPAGSNPGTPDFAFAWDSQASNQSQKAKHGLEMMVYGSSGNPNKWGDLAMNDLDGESGSKGANDINGNIGGRGYDGMVRVETGATGVSGTTGNSYVEFAVSWNYLQTPGVGLAQGQSWNVSAGAIYQANDHNTVRPNGDILGAGLDDLILSGSGSGWGLQQVPEPVNVALGVFGVLALGGAVGRRFLANRGTKKA